MLPIVENLSVYIVYTILLPETHLSNVYNKPKIGLFRTEMPCTGCLIKTVRFTIKIKAPVFLTCVKNTGVIFLSVYIKDLCARAARGTLFLYGQK